MGNVGESFNKARRELVAWRHGGVRINDALWYHVSTEKEYPDRIFIHLYEMDVGKKYLERKAALDLFKEGLSELADRLEADPKLASITEIVGLSTIVYEHAPLVESLGFTITEKDEDRNEALAKMNREEFLRRPWEK